jgi:hypothetical protein
MWFWSLRVDSRRTDAPASYPCTRIGCLSYDYVMHSWIPRWNGAYTSMVQVSALPWAMSQLTMPAALPTARARNGQAGELRHPPAAGPAMPKALRQSKTMGFVGSIMAASGGHSPGSVAVVLRLLMSGGRLATFHYWSIWGMQHAVYGMSIAPASNQAVTSLSLSGLLVSMTGCLAFVLPHTSGCELCL